MCGALLEVEMFKKCTPLWHEAHFEVKRVKKRAVSEHIFEGLAWQAQWILHVAKNEPI